MEQIITLDEFNQISTDKSPLREETKDLCRKELTMYYDSNNILVLKKLTEINKDDIFIKVNS